MAVAWVCWRRLKRWWDERRALAAWPQSPVLRLERLRYLRLRTRQVMSVALRLRMPVKRGVVAVLVSKSGMEEQVRHALGWRNRLCFTSSWAELQEAIVRVSPRAIVADPLSDRSGDPEGHLARFSGGWRIPIILYTALTPESAGILLRLSGYRIRHVIFERYDDGPLRFVAALDSQRSEPPLRAA